MNVRKGLVKKLSYCFFLCLVKLRLRLDNLDIVWLISTSAMLRVSNSTVLLLAHARRFVSVSLFTLYGHVHLWAKSFISSTRYQMSQMNHMFSLLTQRSATCFARLCLGMHHPVQKKQIYLEWRHFRGMSELPNLQTYLTNLDELRLLLMAPIYKLRKVQFSFLDQLQPCLVADSAACEGPSCSCHAVVLPPCS